jgi:hypothetical protein
MVCEAVPLVVDWYAAKPDNVREKEFARAIKRRAIH